MKEIKTGLEPLQTDECKALLVLELGAAYNSVRAAQRWAINVRDNDDEGVGTCDFFQAYSIAAAYLAEACKTLWKHKSCILDLAREHGTDENAILEALEIADPKERMQKDVLKRIRDKMTFHWDKDAFDQWISKKVASATKDTPKDHTDEEQIVWRKSAEKVSQAVMWASLEALRVYAFDLTGDQVTNRLKITTQVRDVLDAMNSITKLFESAILGFLERHQAIES